MREAASSTRQILFISLYQMDRARGVFLAKEMSFAVKTLESYLFFRCSQLSNASICDKISRYVYEINPSLML